MVRNLLIRRAAVILLAVFFLTLSVIPSPAVEPKKKKKTAPAARAAAPSSTKQAKSAASKNKRKVWSPWDTPTYADSTSGDLFDGEDLAARQAAVEALGGLNGSVVVMDPNSGRVLAMVNQRLALSIGFQPCSTIKVPVALAALSEGVIDRNTPLRIYGRTRMNLTEALARSNNPYFAKLGVDLGYEKISYYARLFGLGEKAGLNIPGEKAGYFPPAPPKNGGMGMLTSFGEEISLTPLQLAALMGAIANGGTLYYLQHPQSAEELHGFVPRVKRQLEIEPLIPEVRPGMRGAVEYGTARRAYAVYDDPMMGKTGTCSEGRTHLGWFGSFNEVGSKKLVVVVLLTGGKPSIGPAAAGVAGNVYRRLADRNYFADSRQPAGGTLASNSGVSTR